MTTVTMNISLTEDLKSFVERLTQKRFQPLIEQGLESALLPQDFDLASHLQQRVEHKAAQIPAKKASRA